MKKLVVVICVLAPFTMAAKKQKPQVVVEVVESRDSVRFDTRTAKADQSNINCRSMANATETGIRAADSSANCTTTTDALPPQPTVTRILEVKVQAVMPDGKRITLVCQQGRRGCGKLTTGSHKVEIDGDSAWVYVQDGSKVRKTKYQLASDASIEP